MPQNALTGQPPGCGGVGLRRVRRHCSRHFELVRSSRGRVATSEDSGGFVADGGVVMVLGACNPSDTPSGYQIR